MAELKIVISAENLSKEAFKKLNADVANTVNQFKQLGSVSVQTVDKLDDTVKGARESFLGLGVALGAVSASSTLLLRSLINTAVTFDTMKRGLIAVEGGSQQASRALLNLREVAKLPGLNLQQAVQGYVNLRSIDMGAELAKRSLMAFGNALATVGKGAESLQLVILALTQMSAKGKVIGQDLRQLQEQLPQIRKMMQSAFGTADVEELQRKMEQLGLTANDFIRMMVVEFEKLPKMTSGARNALENYNDAMMQLKASLGDVLLPAFTNLLNSISAMVDEFNKMPTAVKSFTSYSLLAVSGVSSATLAIAGLIRVMTFLRATTIPALIAGFQGLTAVMATNPYLLLATAIATAGTALALYLNKMGSAEERSRKLAESTKKVTEEFGKVEVLSKHIQNYDNLVKATTEAISLRNEVAKQFPMLVAGYDKEGNAILKNVEALKEYNEELKKKAEGEKQKQVAKLKDRLAYLETGLESAVFWANRWQEQIGKSKYAEGSFKRFQADINRYKKEIETIKGMLAELEVPTTKQKEGKQYEQALYPAEYSEKYLEALRELRLKETSLIPNAVEREIEQFRIRRQELLDRLGKASLEERGILQMELRKLDIDIEKWIRDLKPKMEGLGFLNITRRMGEELRGREIPKPIKEFGGLEIPEEMKGLVQMFMKDLERQRKDINDLLSFTNENIETSYEDRVRKIEEYFELEKRVRGESFENTIDIEKEKEAILKQLWDNYLEWDKQQKEKELNQYLEFSEREQRLREKDEQRVLESAERLKEQKQQEFEDIYRSVQGYNEGIRRTVENFNDFMLSISGNVQERLHDINQQYREALKLLDVFAKKADMSKQREILEKWYKRETARVIAEEYNLDRIVTQISRLPYDLIQLYIRASRMSVAEDLSGLYEYQQEAISQIYADETKTYAEKAREIQRIERETAEERRRIEQELLDAKKRMWEDYAKSFFIGILESMINEIEKRIAERLTTALIDKIFPKSAETSEIRPEDYFFDYGLPLAFSAIKVFGGGAVPVAPIADDPYTDALIYKAGARSVAYQLGAKSLADIDYGYGAGKMAESGNIADVISGKLESLFNREIVLEIDGRQLHGVLKRREDRSSKYGFAY